ncbi:MAG: T9SS type A sorting domain-containing protein [Saprospiraceae bacterium]|nr:T9SS type A sorting domain-containing protein [Saprospiraceae bacterium]
MKIYLFFLMLFINLVDAQSQNFKKYSSGEVENLTKIDTSLSKALREKEIEFSQYYNNEFILFEPFSDITLPIVLNIIETPDKKITEENIIYQMEALNKAFNNEVETPEDHYYKDKAVSTKIRFCVPEINSTFVRKRTVPSGTVFRDLYEMANEDKGLAPYLPQNFINIWVSDLGQIQEGPQIFESAGYSQLPMREAVVDGIVIDIDHFGHNSGNSFYGQGYTLAHLMGNFLGLKPLDGFGNCGGDEVDDTPSHNTETLLCLPHTESMVLSTVCFFVNRRMNRNFMDNVPDECTSMFTYGQMARMQAMLGLKGPRRSFVDEAYFGCTTVKTNSISTIIEKDSYIRLYPNPGNDKIFLEEIQENFFQSGRPYKVYSFEGRFMEGGVLSNKQEINTTDWSTGLYFLIFEGIDNRYKKIVFEIVR